MRVTVMFVNPAAGPAANHVPETLLVAGSVSGGPQLTVTLTSATAAMPNARENGNLCPNLRIIGVVARSATLSVRESRNGPCRTRTCDRRIMSPLHLTD